MTKPAWRQTWEKHTEWPLAAVALDAAMLGLYWVFVVDYLARLVLADNRTRWCATHLFDLATVALPFLRPLRILLEAERTTPDAQIRTFGEAVWRSIATITTVGCGDAHIS